MNNSFTYIKSKQEIWAQLELQLGFLRASCTSYDLGIFAEALRIAASIYTIVHDNPAKIVNNSMSILTQLEIKTKMEFLTTCDINYSIPIEDNEWRNPVALATVYPIGTYEDVTKITYRPNLSSFLNGQIRTLSFTEWYDEIVFETWDRKPLSRRMFILTMSNQDGGRHVDPTIRHAAYHAISRGRDGCGYRKIEHGYEVMMPLSMNGQRFELPSDMIPVPNAHWATMRQIGWEVEASFILAGLQKKWPAPPDLLATNLPNEHPYRRLLELPPRKPGSSQHPGRAKR